MSHSSSPAEPSPRTAVRGRPPKLDPDRTVTTALALLDETGLDALTMRRLAEAMGVQAGALYRYFATKQDLLTAMAERMLAGLADPADGHTTAPMGAGPRAGATGAAGAAGAAPRAGAAGAGPRARAGAGAGAATDARSRQDWDAQLATSAHALRAALLRHRDGARVFAGTHSTGGNTLGFAEAVIGTLREAGFGSDDAAQAMLTLVNFTLGHTLEEQAALDADGPADAERLRQAVAESALPHLTATVPVITGGDFDAQFAFGLRLLINGLRAQASSST
ncbi:TetR/AcrR family transcriptional regulator [Actinomycetota bacterium Odt1-20B]